MPARGEREKGADPPIVRFKTPGAFERWLAKHHGNADGIWLQTFKKASGEKSITHSEAVDVALCFGWIDGQGKSYDERSWVQRFTPRRRRSVWSKLNRERIERLIASGKMHEAGMREVERAKQDGRWQAAYDPPSKMEMPDELLKALKRNKKAGVFFETLNKRNTYAIAHRINTAKKPETRERRVKQIVEMLARGEKFY